MNTDQVLASLVPAPVAKLFDGVPPEAYVQLGVATLLAAAVVLLLWWRRIPLLGESAASFARGLAQVVIMGFFLVALLQVHFGWGFLVLLGMVAGAAYLSRKRAQGLPDAFRITFAGLVIGATVTLAAMLAAGALDLTARSLIPIGSMVIANTMRACSLALDRFGADVESRRGRIEALLALGADREQALGEVMQTTVKASLIPSLDALRSLGWIWIPGVMTGMLLAGADPVHAAIFQFVIIALIFATAVMASLTITYLGARAIMGNGLWLERPTQAD